MRNISPDDLACLLVRSSEVLTAPEDAMLLKAGELYASPGSNGNVRILMKNLYTETSPNASLILIFALQRVRL